MPRFERLMGYIPEHEKSKRVIDRTSEIQAIDEAVEGNKEELGLRLKKLEDENRNNWSLGTLVGGLEYYGTSFAVFPEHDETRFLNEELIKQAHQLRFGLITEALSEEGIEIEDGGVKSFARAKQIKEELVEEGIEPHCPDLSRMRLVVPNLDKLESTHYILMENISQLPGFKNIAVINHYKPNFQKKYPTPYRGMATRWSNTNSTSEIARISTEIQLVTSRVRDVMDLNHPFDVRQTLEYPDDEMREYVHSLLLKASILDFEERFGKSI